MKKMISVLAASAMLATSVVAMTGCGATASNGEQVVIYSNADEEAAEAMKAALDANGYSGKYIFQSMGTSELGGKILAESSEIEADVVTMSSYYLDSAETSQPMFADFTFETNTLEESPSFYSPILAIEGAILLNTELIEEEGLDVPTSLKDLADPQYAGHLSVTDITGSSTAWLMVQALVEAYGEEEAQTILAAIYENAGAHLEQSGSGPLKKVRAGEVAIGFGLRHQAVADKADGLPIDFVDPTEGNFSLQEAIAVVDKGEETNALAMEMAQCIIEQSREEIQSYYPLALYEGESTNASNLSTYPKVFSETLTVDLLKEHEALSEEAK